MTDTRACVAFLSVCLWALLAPLSAISAQAASATADRFPLNAPGAAGDTTSGRVVETDDFSDPLATGGQGPEMVVVQAGTFRMGCLAVSGCSSDELPDHEVVIAYRFALSKYEITFADWDACVDGGGCDGYLPDDEGWGRARRPVINVSWHDAQAYVAWLSESTDETYRLPSEAEWEYTARAGSSSRYTWGDRLLDDYANCLNDRCKDEHPNTAPAGSFPANAWGFHDMHGNVFEWVQDCWNGTTYEGAPTDGSAWLDGHCDSRMIRGGSWAGNPASMRSANRVQNPIEDRRSSLGFRVARALPRLHFGLVPLFPPAASGAPEGFVRVINHSETAGEVRIDAFDDSGRSYGPVTLSMDAFATVHFNSEDLEQGNAAKGLTDGLGSAMGNRRLRLSSILDIETLSYIRTPDGFLTAMQDTVPANEGEHRVAIFNPGRNHDQVSHLRLINPGDEDSEITITGVDDVGIPGETASLSLPAGESRTFSSQQLQAGRGGLDGGLGTGKGKWHLTVAPSTPILVVNILESPTGALTNLSTAPAHTDEDGYLLPLFLPKSTLGRQGFARVINRSEESGSVQIYAVDDDGRRRGPLSLTVDAGAAAHFNSADLEDGNLDKGLSGSTGAGAGDWRLELTSDLDMEALAYVRTDDGFVTTMHDIAPRQANHHRIAVFNPGSNRNQVSLLRLVNPTKASARISIRGIDDAGDPSARVELTLPAGQARTYSAWELESGGGDLQGSLGDGTGKWQLEVASDQPVLAMSLLESPTGHLTNLSVADFRRARLATARDVFDELISGPIAQTSCVGCHVAGGEADDTRLTLVPDSTAEHARLNREALADFVNLVEEGESLILAKMRGDADHGGGVQVAVDSAEYANVVRFLRLVVVEGTALFDATTYAGRATIGNGETMAAGDLLIEVPERTLIDDIAISVDETILPAALPPGIRQIADPVEIVISDKDQDNLNGPLMVTMTYPEGAPQNGDIVALRYEPASAKWSGATLKSHDPSNRTVVLETRVAGSFVVGSATFPLSDKFSTGFDPTRHGFNIDNGRIEYHTEGGNSFGMSAYAIYHFNFGNGDLRYRWTDTVQTVVATLAQSTTPTMFLNSRWWNSFRLDQVSSIQRTIRFSRSPVVLMLARPGGGHAVVAYGHEGDELLIYDPDHPGQARKTSGGGRQYRSGSRAYSVSHAVQISSVGRPKDFDGLKDAADARFSDSQLLNVDVRDGQEVHGRKLGFSGILHGALDHGDVRVSVYDGRYRHETTRNADGSFGGSLNVHHGENAVAFLAGRLADAKHAPQPAPFTRRNWELPSAALIRRVTGITDKAVLRTTVGWKPPTDVDIFVQEPDDGELLFWGNRETVNALTFNGDDRGVQSSDVEHSETAILLEPWGPLEGEYRVFLHQYDDHGLNDDLNVTVDIEVYEGHGTRNVPFLHGATIRKGQYGLAGAATVRELLDESAVEVARVDPGKGQICFFDSASGRYDECADRTEPGLGKPEPVTATNGGATSTKPDSVGLPALQPVPDLEFTIDSSSLPASDCNIEGSWRACYHTQSAAADDLIEVKVKLPEEPSGLWHGAWCMKATPEGLCEGGHDRTDRVEKRFAGNATLRFVTRTPRDATSFWIVGEIRECGKPLCNWPTDYTEVEFHHIEIDVEAGTVDAGAASLYWLDGGLVRRSALDGSSISTLVDFGMDVGDDLAVDLPDGKAYLVDENSGTVRRANLDGSSVETIVRGLRRLDGIALDGQGKVYYAAEGIHRADLDGSNRETLISSLPWPKDVALDTTDRWIYWVDHVAGRIQRSRLDGSGLRDLVRRGLRLPEGIALDVDGRKMYWTDRETGTVHRSNLDGSVAEEVISGLNNPHSIAVHSPARKVYWTELGSDTIRRANVNGTGVEVVVDGVRRGGLTGLIIVDSD